MIRLWGRMAAIAIAGSMGHCRETDVTHTNEAVGLGRSPESPDAAAPAPLAGPSEPAAEAAALSPDVSSPVALLTAACGSGVLTAAGKRAIDRKPYLQQVTATSAAVLFTTRGLGLEPTLRLTGPAGSLVEVVPTEADPQDATGYQRLARLSNLEPNTVYCYEIEDWLTPVGFRTAPRAGTGVRVRFVVFGDSGGDSRGLLRPTMDRVPFDLMLHVGDIAYSDGSLANFEAKFFDTYSTLLEHVPIFPASGNHEYATAAAAYRQVFALPENGAPDGLERWFSYDWGDIHFVALDTELVAAPQAAWLERDLTNNVLPWKVVYMHRPPYSSGSHGSSLGVREAFSPLFERFGVQLVLSGHDHDYERTKLIGGVTYIVTGGGGYSVRNVGSSEFTVYSQAVFHLVQAEVREDELLLRAIGASGEVIDETTIARVPLTAAP
jgi:calcineurin-like phosphoesterase family protein